MEKEMYEIKIKKKDGTTNDWFTFQYDCDTTQLSDLMGRIKTYEFLEVYEWSTRGYFVQGFVRTSEIMEVYGDDFHEVVQIEESR